MQCSFCLSVSLLYRVQAQFSNLPLLCWGEGVENGDGMGGNFFLSEGGDLELSPLIGFWLLEERRLSYLVTITS